MSLDDLFTECAESQWHISNLYQSSSTGLWRVNLYHPEPGGASYGDWAEATTLHEALAEAMAKMADAEFEADTAPTFSQSREAPPSPSGLLAKLGLAKPKVTIERRL